MWYFNSQSSSQYSYNPPLTVKYDSAAKRITASLTMDREGCYQAVATYNGTRIKNPEFTILVLNGEYWIIS